MHIFQLILIVSFLSIPFVENISSVYRYYKVSSKITNEDIMSRLPPGSLLTGSFDKYHMAIKYKLMFKFPFYGIKNDSLYISKMGFVYFDNYIYHKYKNISENIAPFMMNIDVMKMYEPLVYVKSLQNSIYINWSFKNKLNSSQDLNVTLQLLEDGDIDFYYKKIPDILPKAVMKISDGFYIRKGNLLQFTSYDNISLSFPPVSWSIYRFTQRESCQSKESCDSCSNFKRSDMNCRWCFVRSANTENFCSDISSRGRQELEWYDNDCHKNSVKDDKDCNRISGVNLTMIILMIIALLLIVIVIVTVIKYHWNHPSRFGNCLHKMIRV